MRFSKILHKSDVMMASYAFFTRGILPLRQFDVRMTSYKNFIADFGFRIQTYPLYQI